MSSTDEKLKDVVGLHVAPEIETTSICDLQRQLTVTSPLFPERTIATRDDLVSYAHLFGIPVEGSDQELAEQIRREAPCEWIERVYRWARETETPSYYLNRYVTDIAMDILSKIRKGTPLSSQEAGFMPGVDQAIRQSPRPSRGFKVYRGVHSAPGKVGDIITMGTPKSGSFSLDPVLSGYIGEGDCCLIEIYIPANAVVTYHPSEDQVIFPSEAQLYVIGGPTLVRYPVFGEEHSLITYQAVYIGPPSPPRSGSSLYDGLSINDAYYIAILRGLPFPYGRDPYTSLREADRQDPTYLQQISSGSIRPNGSETRLYLKLRGYNVNPVTDYSYEQMLPTLKMLGLI